jgi:hypothetical protein
MAEPDCRVNDRRLIGVTGTGNTTVDSDLTKQLGRTFCADNVVTFSFTSNFNELVRAAEDFVQPVTRQPGFQYHRRPTKSDHGLGRFEDYACESI